MANAAPPAPALTGCAAPITPGAWSGPINRTVTAQATDSRDRIHPKTTRLAETVTANLALQVACDGTVTGSISNQALNLALDCQGQLAWHHEYSLTEGNIRGSVAVADLNGDGVLDVVLPIGCYGALKAYDGATGDLEWVRQLGPRTQASPSLGDLDGDGKLEIVVASYDGQVYAFEGGAREYLPLVVRQ